jgi:hypothetical protein
MGGREPKSRRGEAAQKSRAYLYDEGDRDCDRMRRSPRPSYSDREPSHVRKLWLLMRRRGSGRLVLGGLVGGIGEVGDG